MSSVITFQQILGAGRRAMRRYRKVSGERVAYRDPMGDGKQAVPSFPIKLAILLSLTAALAVGCSHHSKIAEQSTNSEATKVEPAASAQAPVEQANDGCSQRFDALVQKEDSLTYDGFTVTRVRKTVREKEFGDIDETYGVLTKDGKHIAAFEGAYHPIGNEFEFGLAQLLGGDGKQLAVAQTIPRNGRQWIVDLTSGAIIFDSQEWGLGQEPDHVCVQDLDGDGVAEIAALMPGWGGLKGIPMSERYGLGVIFKYDTKSRKYIPDKAYFARMLDGIDEDTKKIDKAENPREEQKSSYLKARLDIFQRYVYSGHEEQGWKFFDEAYSEPDKSEIKASIKQWLKRDPIYRYLYNKRA